MVAEASLTTAFEALDLGLDPATRQRLELYLQTLRHWNRSMNLTALDAVEQARRLVAEPVWVARELQAGGRYLDIGSGNGSPAFPWLATRPFEAGDLVESRSRRAVFLRRTARKLDLPVTVHPVRFEAFVSPESADWVTVQGVRLSADVLERLASDWPQARIVWFSKGDGPVPPKQRLDIPGSDRCALIFGA